MQIAVANSPRPVIRGESPFLPVSIDYLNFTVPDGSVREIISEVQAFLGVVQAEERGRGLHGYDRSVDFGGYGVVAYGGANQRGTVLVSINGAGCQRVASFARVRAWAEPLRAKVTRCDIAADDHESVSVDVSRAVEAWRSGAFATGGRPPKARAIDDFGSGEGRTLYVGSREGGKLCRVYDKGKQLGDPSSKWTRAEVELHAKDRVIPWDAVTEPVRFLAGSFPFFSFLSLVAERIKTIKKTVEISIQAVQSWVKAAAGKSLHVLCEHFGGDVGALFVAVRREGVPHRLRGVWDLRLEGVT